MSELLKRENVRIVDATYSWEEAIRQAAATLVEGAYITPAYVDAIIANVHQHGPYIVIAPQVALPHARPENGVNTSQFAILLSKQAVFFSEEKPDVHLFVTMAATDNGSYLGGLVAISEVLQDEAKLREIINTDSEDKLFAFFQAVNN